MNSPQTSFNVVWNGTNIINNNNTNNGNNDSLDQTMQNRTIYEENYLSEDLIEDMTFQETAQPQPQQQSQAQQQPPITHTIRDIIDNNRYTSIDIDIDGNNIVNTTSCYDTNYSKYKNALRKSLKEDVVAVIALLMNDNRYKCITLYNKGYVYWCGIVLYKYYYSYSKVSKLVSLGSLEYLNSEIDDCVPMITKSDMDDSVNSITKHAPIIYNDVSSIRRIQASYYYIFSNNCWKIGIIGNRHYSYLDDALVYADIIPITYKEKHQLQQKIFDYDLI